MPPFLRLLFSQFIFLFGLIWGVVGTPFLAIGVWTAWTEYDVRHRGVPTEATLVEKGHSTSNRGGSSYTLKYVFTDSSGRERVREDSVGWETWRRHQDGDKVRVLYLPDKPSSSRLRDAVKRDWWVLPVVFSGMGILFAGVGWSLVAFAVARTVRKLEILRTGMIVTGKVARLREDLNTSINGRHPLVLLYAFTGPDGRQCHGETSHLPRALEGRWKEGDPIAVVYDPRDPSRHEADVLGVRVPLDGGLPS